jgi:AcrR family transcriptional regulator
VIGRRERKREQTKQGLINAAVELFIAKGYDETTIDDIVAAADVAKVTFYYYFKSKEEIILAIKETSAQEVLSRAETLLTEQVSAPEILHVFITDMGRWTEKNWRLLKAFAAQRFGPMMQGETCGDPEKPIPFIVLLEQIIKHGQKTGQFRKEINPIRTSHFIMLALMQEQFSWIAEGRKKASLTNRMENCLDFMLHGIVRRK